jgi:hypothetical protein
MHEKFAFGAVVAKDFTTVAAVVSPTERVERLAASAAFGCFSVELPCHAVLFLLDLFGGERCHLFCLDTVIGQFFVDTRTWYLFFFCFFCLKSWLTLQKTR